MTGAYERSCAPVYDHPCVSFMLLVVCDCYTGKTVRSTCATCGPSAEVVTASTCEQAQPALRPIAVFQLHVHVAAYLNSVYACLRISQ